jgi:hypothetical protein
MDVPCLEQKQRKEQPRLMAGDPPSKPLPALCVLSVKHQNAWLDIRIGADLVRVSMVGVVLVYPPAIAEAGQEVRIQQTEQPARAGPMRHLAMTRVVGQEADLSKDDGEGDGDPHQPPGVA